MNDSLFLERRKEERISVKDNSMFVEVFLNCPKDYKIYQPIVDISPSGLSFLMNEEEGHFSPQTILNNITIKDDKQTKRISRVETRYCIPLEIDGKTYHKIGIEFIIKPFEKSLIRRKFLSSYNLRFPRFDCKLFPTLNWDISFSFKDNVFQTQEVLNFSKTGIAFHLNNIESYSLSDKTLDNAVIKVNGKIFYQGELKVVSNQNHIIRCYLINDWLNINKIFAFAKKEKIRAELGLSISKNIRSRHIDSNYKCTVFDLKDLLLNVKDFLDMEETKIKTMETDGDNKEAYQSMLLDIISDLSFPNIDNYLATIQNITKSLSKNDDNTYKAYFRKHLHSLFLLSPFNNRAFTKPLAYAGDYEMMNMIYRDMDEGTSFFAKLMNRHILTKTAPNAVRGRAKYVTDKITQLLADKFKNNNSVSITNIACGPAKEIQDLFRTNSEIDKCKFTFVDADERPLLYSQQVLTELKRKHNRQTEMKFVHKAIDQIIKDRDWKNKIKKQDVVYSIGLLDYLSPIMARRMISSLYELLDDNGILMIGNINNSNDTRNFMEYVGEWYIIHRNDQELLALSNKLNPINEKKLERDQTNVCNFLLIKK